MTKKINFKKAASTLQRIEDTNSRLEMTDILVEFFEEVSAEDAQIFAYLLEGRVAPMFIPSEFSFAEKSILNMLEEFVKLNDLDVDVNGLRQKVGDIGLTVERIIQKLNKDNYNEYTIGEIYSKLWDIIITEGEGSVERKSNIIGQLLQEISPVEAKFFSRIVVGKLRVGCNAKTILDSLSVLLIGEKDLRDELDKVYGYNSDIGYIVDAVRELKRDGKQDTSLLKADPIPGIPVLSRLVQRVGDLDEAVKRMTEEDDVFIVQPKFDGMRCQIHKGVDYSGEIFKDRVWYKHYIQTHDVKRSDDLFGKTESNVRLFSRNLEDLTDMFPDIVDVVEALPAKSLIIDTEIVGVEEYVEDFESNADFEYIPFQKVMTRRRKYDIASKKESVPVVTFVFDILEKDGESVAHRNTYERIEMLEDFLESSSSHKEKVILSDSLDISNVEELEQAFEKYVDAGLEGVIAKKITGGYTPGARNFDWIKIKKSIQSKVVDTIDVVIVGYYYGSGKRSEFGMGALLCAVYQAPEGDEIGKFIPITKLGTGITDKQWKSIKDRLDKIERGHGEDVRHKQVEDGGYVKPDVWVEPEVVCTIEGDEITKSSVYDVGKDDLGSGLGLRFPRLMEFDRDKSPEDATSEMEIVEMFKMKE